MLQQRFLVQNLLSKQNIYFYWDIVAVCRRRRRYIFRRLRSLKRLNESFSQKRIELRNGKAHRAQ